MQTCACSLMRTVLVQLLVFPKSVQARNNAKICSLAALQLSSSWLEAKHKGTWKWQLNKKEDSLNARKIQFLSMENNVIYCLSICV